MPEMVVNDRYSAFHKFCNFLDKICQISQPCYHTRSPHTSKSVNAEYECGEGILYKNGDHLETGTIESISKSDKINLFCTILLLEMIEK